MIDVSHLRTDANWRNLYFESRMLLLPVKTPQAIVVVGHVTHDVPLASPEPKCHAGSGHGNARDRGAMGILCGPCEQATLRLLRRVVGPR